jgi:hypothetical protein
MKLAPLLLVLIAVIAALAKVNEPEIRRYLKISSM